MRDDLLGLRSVRSLNMYILLWGLALLSVVVTTPTPQVLTDLKIVGGDDIEITDAPYMVSLISGGRHSCGGTIIANDIVVTAAHCVSGSVPKAHVVRVGSSYSDKGGELHPIGAMAVHPGFTFSNMDSDIAVLWLSIPLKFSESVFPIELSNEDDNIRDGEMTIVTGWGNIMEGGCISAVLQRILVPKVNENVCHAAYASFYTVTSSMLCAGVPEGGKDACQGDSGGPLVHNNKLAGVVSWGLGCARPDYPGVYARVSALRRWLDDNIKMLRMKQILRDY